MVKTSLATPTTFAGQRLGKIAACSLQKGYEALNNTNSVANVYTISCWKWGVLSSEISS